MAKEYIEREALEVALNHRLNFLMAENGEYDHYTSGFDEAVTRVENFPAADVAEVRCKDCKWYSELACGEIELLGSQGWCNEVMARPMSSNGFCSLGERKKGHGQTNGI